MSKEEINKKFLELCGFEPDEIRELLPDWTKTYPKLKLTEADIKYATEKYIPSIYDIQYLGIRKMIGKEIREVIDFCKAPEYKEKGYKMVYGIQPAHCHFYYALKMAAPEKVFISFPDIEVVDILQWFFNKPYPFFEEAEKYGMTYGYKHCGLNKTRYTVDRWKTIPPADISWIFGFVCDEGPKTDEFIHEYHDPNWNYYSSRAPHDTPYGLVEYEDEERLEYLATELREGFKAAQKAIGVEVPDEIVDKALEERFRYMLKVGELFNLMTSDPQPLGGSASNLFLAPLFMAFNTGYKYSFEAMDVLIDEVKKKVAKKEGILPKGAPKAMMYIIPWAISWVVPMFQKCEVGVPFASCFMPCKAELAPPKQTETWMAAAETWLKWDIGLNTGLRAKLELEKIEMFHPDAMIYGFLDFDRWIGSDHKMLCRIVGEKSEIPTFYVEGDLWDDRDYSREALRTRIETICEIIKMRTAAKGGT